MTTINIKEIEELSAFLRHGIGDALTIAKALDALLAFYKEVNEQETVATIADLYELDRHELIGRGYPHDACLYALPPSSAARIAELEGLLTEKGDTLIAIINKQAEKLRTARKALYGILNFPESRVYLDDVKEALATLGE